MDIELYFDQNFNGIVKLILRRLKSAQILLVSSLEPQFVARPSQGCLHLSQHQMQVHSQNPILNPHLRQKQDIEQHLPVFPKAAKQAAHYYT